LFLGNKLRKITANPAGISVIANTSIYVSSFVGPILYKSMTDAETILAVH
jgi:hypothetical protein